MDVVAKNVNVLNDSRNGRVHNCVLFIFCNSERCSSSPALHRGFIPPISSCDPSVRPFLPAPPLPTLKIPPLPPPLPPPRLSPTRLSPPFLLSFLKCPSLDFPPLRQRSDLLAWLLRLPFLQSPPLPPLV